MNNSVFIDAISSLPIDSKYVEIGKGILKTSIVSGKIVRRGTLVYVHDDYTDDELTQHFKEINKEKLDGVVIPVNSGKKVFIHDDQSIDMVFVNSENISFDVLEHIFPKMKRDFSVMILNCDNDKTFETINMFCNKYEIWNKTGFSESTLVRLVITDSKPPSPPTT